MKKPFFFMLALFTFWNISCAPRPPEEETLLRYARSRDLYMGGRFAETASMLADETKFIPALVLRGKAEYLSGNTDAASGTLRKALSLNPNDTEASLFLARLCRETGESAEAQKLVEKILADNPQEIRTLRLASELARERGVAGEAASAVFLDRAVEASSELALVFLARARLRWTGGNRSGSLEDLGRARALLSGDDPVLKAVERLEAVIKELS